MKVLIKTLFFLSVIIFAYLSANQKMRTSLKFQGLKLGMSEAEVEKSFGGPWARYRNQMVYFLKDGPELTITLQDGNVASAHLKFKHPLKIEDPEFRNLTLVQMDAGPSLLDGPSWFFAGRPEEGLIYKITAQGLVVGLTLVPPFKYGNTQAKQLQTLLRDFQGQYLPKL